VRILVWQWGRRGAGPRYAAELVRAFNQERDATALLSLSERAELMQTQTPPQCALPVPTYAGLWGFGLRLLWSPVLIPRLVRWLRRERIEIALCAMPAAMDLVMAASLRLAGVPYVVIVHEADLHPGDRFALQIRLQRWLVGGARALFVLSAHVAERASVLGLVGPRTLMMAALPPFHYGHDLPPPGAHGGKLRLLSFGRLLPYKGLDLLADGLARLGPRDDLEIRVVGSGPESPALDRLRALPGVSVENRWVYEEEMASVLGWADALVLSHREASQSGVAAAAIAARRWVIATRVGGLPEQLGAEPTAILCDPDPASLAEAIAALLAMERTPPEQDGAADAAWRRTAQRMVERLRELAGERKSVRLQSQSPAQ
jgi:glycosyltransferase involved in cell wall biosynthesis